VKASKSTASKEKPAWSESISGLVSRLDRDILVRLSREDVLHLLQILMDGDREESHRFVVERLGPKVKKILSSPG